MSQALRRGSMARSEFQRMRAEEQARISALQKEAATRIQALRRGGFLLWLFALVGLCDKQAVG